MNITIISSDPVMNIGIVMGALLFTFLGILFAIYIVSLFRRNDSGKEDGPLPAISIIVPAHNEELTITDCLRSIVTDTYRGAREIIVVDDGSTDKTAEAVLKFTKKLQYDKNRRKESTRIRLVSQECGGKVVALNNGVRVARHNIIVCIDADVRIGRGTLREMAAPLRDKRVGATNAVTFIDSPRGWIGHAQAVEYALNSTIRSSFARVFGTNIWFYGAVAAYRRDALDTRTPFKRHTLTEDMDISLELFAKGKRVITCERAAAYTLAERSVARLIRQRMRWFYGALQALFRHRKHWHNGVPAPVVFLYANQWWWTIFSFAFFPITAYQVMYWWPGGVAASSAYLARWFSIVGPFYVLWKIPAWGLSTLNIFGVLAGIITLIMTVGALVRFWPRTKGWNPILTIIAIAFYFPYTIIMNVSIILGVFYYRITGARYFKK